MKKSLLAILVGGLIASVLPFLSAQQGNITPPPLQAQSIETLKDVDFGTLAAGEVMVLNSGNIWTNTSSLTGVTVVYTNVVGGTQYNIPVFDAAGKLSIDNGLNFNGAQDEFSVGAQGMDGTIRMYSEIGTTDYWCYLRANTNMSSDAYFYFPADEPAAQSLMAMTAVGVMQTIPDSAGVAAAINDETGTGVLVFGTSPTFTTKITTPEIENTGGITIDSINAGATSTVDVTNSDGSYTANLAVEGDIIASGGMLQGGAAGQDGQLDLYSEQGASDFTLSIIPSGVMADNETFTFLAASPTEESWLTMGTDNVLDLTAISSETLAAVTARGATSAQSLTLTGATPLALGDDVAGGSPNVAGWLKLFSAGDNAFYVTITTGTQTQNVAYTLPLDDGGASEVLITDGSGVLDWVAASTLEADTLATVTTRGATTTNAITTGAMTSGANGADGKLTLYSEQGGTDYAAGLNPNATMTSAAEFYLPADEPAGTYLLNMTTGGVIGFDSNTYLTAEADTLDTVAGRGASTDVALSVTSAVPQITLGEDIAGGTPNTPGQVKLFSSGDDAYYATLAAGALTSNAAYTLPVDEPAGTYILNMTTGGQIGYDASTYLTAEADTLGDVTGRGASTATLSTFTGGLTLGADDDPSNLILHSASTIQIYDDSDDFSVTIGPVADGTTTLGVTGTIDATGLKVGGAAVLTAEVDGDVSNEINTFTADAGGATSGLAVTLAGGGIVATARAGDTVTITGTEADTLDAVMGRGANTDVDMVLEKSGGDLDSPYLDLIGESDASNVTARIQMMQGDDPYLRVSVTDDDASPTLVPVIDIKDTRIVVTNDGTVDLGVAGNAFGNATFTATVTAEHLASTDDADVVDNLTAGDIVIDEATGVLDFTGATSATISSSVAGKLTMADSTIISDGYDDKRPSLEILGDADSDAGGDTSETVKVVLTPAADPTTAVWDITSTQSAGYKYDKSVWSLGTIHAGIDDDRGDLEVHDNGTLKFWDDGDDSSVTMGSVADGTDDLTITGDVNVTGTITGMTKASLDTDATITLTDADCKGGYRLNDDADAIEYDLPQLVDATDVGMVITIANSDVGAANAITVDANTGDKIVLSGALGAAAAAIVSDGATLGATITLCSIDTTRWMVVGTPVGAWAVVP